MQEDEDQTILLVKRLVENLPIDISIKFIHRLFTIDIETSIKYTIHEYEKLLINIYDKKSIYNSDHLLFTDMFIENIISNTISVCHILTDNTNNIVHLNSDNVKSISASIHKLMEFGYIPIKTSLVKNAKIFTMKYYESYKLAGGNFLSICKN